MSAPLSTEVSLPPAALFQSHWKAAEYVAFVALGGRYAYCREPRGWYRHNTVAWVPTDMDVVRSAVRRAYGETFDRLAGDPRYSPDRFRLIDMNWVLAQLDVVRRVVTVPCERLEGTP